jgi:hypothetical protein
MFIEMLKESSDEDLKEAIFEDILNQVESRLNFLANDKASINNYLTMYDNKITKKTAYNYLYNSLVGRFFPNNKPKDYLSKCKCWREFRKNKNWQNILNDIIKDIQDNHIEDIIIDYVDDLYTNAKNAKR